MRRISNGLRRPRSCAFVGIWILTASIRFEAITGVTPDVIAHCCDLGRAWATQSEQRCGPYPESYISTILHEPGETLACTALVDTCCVLARREKQCAAGRETAIVLGRCDQLHLYQANEDAKECCNCCHLGLIMRQITQECLVPVQLTFSQFCVAAYSECCLGQSPADHTQGPPLHLPDGSGVLLEPTASLPHQPHLRGPTTAPKAFAATAMHLDVCRQFAGELCAHICVSTADSSYYCQCRDGFVLQSDGKSCLQSSGEKPAVSGDAENVCLTGRHTCADNQRCVKTAGGFRCEQNDGDVGYPDRRRETTPTYTTLPPGRCLRGFAWNRFTRQCEDIDECILEVHTCEPTQSCVNTDGDFRCLDEVDDENEIYDDYYPETDVPHEDQLTSSTASTTTTTTSTTIRPITTRTRSSSKTRRREERPGIRTSTMTSRVITRVPIINGDAFGRFPVSASGERGEDIQCLAGYAPDRRNTQCIDVDECAPGTSICQLPNQICINSVGSYRCECEAGYAFNEDVSFCEDVDECSQASRCARDQVCENTLGSFVCTCAPGFTLDARTRQCTDINECRTVPDICGEAQTCQNVIGSYKCTRKQLTCNTGFEPNSPGTRCVDIDECSTGAACVGGQICENTVGSFTCNCQSGYTFDSRIQQCTDINECRVTPSVCSSAEACENIVGSYRCTRKAVTCSPGYEPNSSGTGCADVNECLQTPGVCGASEECENHPGTYRCRKKSLTCELGYEPNSAGTRCVDKDECVMNEGICGSNRRCENTPGSYACSCEAGYRLNSSTQQCDDVDECQSRQFSCARGHTCVNTPGSYDCRCEAGFVVDARTRTCVDVDECRLNNQSCGVASTCQNTPGSFRCVQKQCPRGQRLDHATGDCNSVVCPRGLQTDQAGNCVDINECLERPSVCRPHQECRNTVGSYRCHNVVTCGSGYELNEGTGRCDDIDECQRGTHRCQGDHVQCINRPGSYHCQCPEGFQMDRQRQSCEDVDECRLYGGRICSQNADCENSPGSFRCICREGFELADDKRSCNDIDECLQPRLCQHTCQNTWGSFSCSCNSGYQLSTTDKRSCSDIDECSVWAQRGTLLCQGICENVPGSYKCTCPPEYHMAADGRVCRDVDECASGAASCGGADDVCINTRGGYKCETVQCPRGFNKVPNSQRNSHAVRCQRKTFQCPQGDAECLYAPISYSVNFIAIPRKLIRVPTDLFTMRGPLTPNRRLQFDLKVVSAQDPRTGAVRANRAFFNLNQVRANEVVVQLVHEISGAQDVHLQLNMNVYSRDTRDGDDDEEVFYGTAVAKIIIYITEDPW